MQGCQVGLFSGQISEIWPRFKLVGLFWPFYAEKVSSEGKYYSFIFSTTLQLQIL